MRVLDAVFWWTGAISWGCFLGFLGLLARVWWLERRMKAPLHLVRPDA